MKDEELTLCLSALLDESILLTDLFNLCCFFKVFLEVDLGLF